MIAAARVTIKQFRFELGISVLAALAVIAVWIVVQVRLMSIPLPGQCVTSGGLGKSDCGPALVAARPIVAGLGARLLEAMRILPFAIGLLAGAPIVARELESRTAQTAWSLNGSRARWLGRQAFGVGLPAVLAAVAVAAVAASVEGVRLAVGDGGAVLNVGLYGVPAVARTVAAFGIGLLLGALLGRSVPALVLGSMLCLALSFALGSARDSWLGTQPASPIPAGETQWITTGWAYQTPSGSTISSDAAFGLVPPEVSALDEGLGQPINAGGWLEQRGYQLVPTGVSQEVSLGWQAYDAVAFLVFGVGAAAASVLVVNRRRPG